MRMPAWSIAMVMRRIAVSNVLSMCTMLPKDHNNKLWTIVLQHLGSNANPL